MADDGSGVSGKDITEDHHDGSQREVESGEPVISHRASKFPPRPPSTPRTSRGKGFLPLRFAPWSPSPHPGRKRPVVVTETPAGRRPGGYIQRFYRDSR